MLYKLNWKLPVYIEHRVAEIIAQQERNGWDFDKEKAIEYVNWLNSEQQECESTIEEDLHPIPVLKNRVNKPFKQNGELSAAGKRYDDLPISGPFTGIEWKSIDVGSRKKLSEQLIRRGWEPSSYTEKGSPQLTVKGKPCPNLEEFDSRLGKAVAHWFNCNHRKGVIGGWINHTHDDGRIYYSVNPCGTNTRRMRHSLVVNVPKAEEKVFFGQEMRSLFTVRDPYVLIGNDIKGLENRIIAHYMIMLANAHEEVEALIDPDRDFHTDFWGAIDDFIDSRSNAKNVEYAYFFGAQDPKLGSMADRIPRYLKGASLERVGAEIRKKIGNRFPSLAQVLAYVDHHVDRYGFLMTPDGGKIYPRGKHSAFNTLIQGTGSVVHKVSVCFLDTWLKRYQLDSAFVGNFHDETQSRVHNNHVEQYRELSEESVVQSGRFLQLKVPMSGESKVGTNWAMTH